MQCVWAHGKKELLKTITNVELICDQCNKKFNRMRSKINKLNFCSQDCQRTSNLKNGKIDIASHKTLMKNFNVTTTFSLSSVREKAQQTNIKKFGSKCPISHKDILIKSKKTLIKHYGVDNASKSQEIKIKKQKNCFLKNGVKHHMQLDLVKQKYDYSLIARKSHATKKKNGTYSKKQSKVEDEFFNILSNLYPTIDIERHHSINNNDIDFYIKSIDTCIQFDGVYWHGLDRDVDLIKWFKNPRDKVIYSTFLRDQKQNTWFEINKKKLIRFTDKEVLEWQKQKNSLEQVRKRIELKLMN
jgi:hypothetical protein